VFYHIHYYQAIQKIPFYLKSQFLTISIQFADAEMGEEFLYLLLVKYTKQELFHF